MWVVQGLNTILSERGIPLGFVQPPLKWRLHTTPLKCGLHGDCTKPPFGIYFKNARKKGCLWEERFWILLDQSEFSKMLCTNDKTSPKSVFSTFDESPWWLWTITNQQLIYLMWQLRKACIRWIILLAMISEWKQIVSHYFSGLDRVFTLQ